MLSPGLPTLFPLWQIVSGLILAFQCRFCLGVDLISILEKGALLSCSCLARFLCAMQGLKMRQFCAKMTPLGNLVLPSTDCVMATIGLIAPRRNQDVIGKRTRKSQRVEDSWHIIIGAGMYFIALWHSIHFVVTPLFHLMQQALVSHIIILIFFLIRKIRISSVLCASSTRGFEFLHFFLLSWSISFWQFLRQCFRNSWRTFQLVFSGWIIFLFFFCETKRTNFNCCWTNRKKSSKFLFVPKCREGKKIPL